MSLSRRLVPFAVVVVAAGAHANTYTVTSTTDTSIAGSLRRAINDANANPGPDTIAFNIGGAAPHVFNPQSPYPAIVEEVILDGGTNPDYAGAPVIEFDGSGVAGYGLTFSGAGGGAIIGVAMYEFIDTPIRLHDSIGVRVEGCHLGTDGAAAAPRGNGTSDLLDPAIDIDGGSGHRIGDSDVGEGNVFVDNALGIRIRNGASDVRIMNNLIGMNVNGQAWGNDGAGVQVETASDVQIGSTDPDDINDIRYNGRGVWVREPIGGGADPGGVTIRGNHISCNDGLGIDLGDPGHTANDFQDADTGPNGLQNHPELLSVIVYGDTTRVIGKMAGVPGGEYTIDLYGNTSCSGPGQAEGGVHLACFEQGTATSLLGFTVMLEEALPLGLVLRATATDDGGNTSEFGEGLPVVVVEPTPSRLYVRNLILAPQIGTSWGTALGELHLALFLAALAPGDVTEIWVSTGTMATTLFQPASRSAHFALQNDLAIYGGFNGNESDLAERSLGNLTVLTGDIGLPGTADNAYHVVIGSGTNASAVLDGFEIRRGRADGAFPDNFGGGLLALGGSPTIRNCAFVENEGSSGAGAADIGGAGTTFINCRFQGNCASGVGGALEVQGGNTSVVNCTVVSNAAGGSGGGIRCLNGPGLSVVNSILWGNIDSGGVDESSQVHVSGSSPSVDHSTVEGLTGGLGGTGNLGLDPMFVIFDGDLHLDDGSPAVDAGDNAALPGGVDIDLDGNSRITDGDGDGTATIDMGCFETAAAVAPCTGNTNGDDEIDVDDLNNVILDWGTDGSANGGDVTGPLPGSPPDGIVNVNDLNAVIVGWGLCPGG